MGLNRAAVISFAAAATFAGAALSIACEAPAPPAAQSSSNQTKRGKQSSSGDADEKEKPAGGDPDIGGDGAEGAGAGAGGAIPSAYACNGAGIAAFADKLATAARKSCTSDGVGVVTDTNFDCIKAPIMRLAPPFPDAAYERVNHWATKGNNYAGKTTLFQCVDFAFTVTAAVCGKPINDGDAQIDENMQIPGYKYMSAKGSAAAAGDVLVMQGHIAITAAVTGGSNIRVAEANCLTLGGEMTQGDDTGVISNSRTDTLTDDWILGWYRKQ